MYKGKGSKPYTILKIALYITGCCEFLFYYSRPSSSMLVILLSVLISNSLFRQFYIYRKEKLYPYGRISIALDFVLGAFIAVQQPVGATILLLTPAIFESVAVYSVTYGFIASLASLISLVTIDMLQREYIPNHLDFFRSILISYILGFVLIYVVSYLASLQFRERERIARVNRELKQAYKQLIDNSSKLSELSVEKERNRMAREIHDTLAHTLTAVVVQIEAGSKLMDIDLAKAKEEIRKAQELTRAGLNDVKRTVKALRPEIFENNTLAGALNNLIQDTQERSSVKVKISENTLKEHKLDETIEISIFRIIQESITNAIRHGDAKQIDISMTEGEGVLNLNITDNGKGCASIKEGYGLKGIGERVKEFRGAVHFSSVPKQGFFTNVTIPLKGGKND